LNYVDEWWDGADGTTDCNGAAAIAVVAGMDNPATDITIDAGGTISGRITDEGGAGIEGIGVEVFTGRCWDNRVGGMDTDAYGDYLIQGLPQGDVYIHAFPQGQNYLEEWYNGTEGTSDCNSAMPVSITSGSTENVDFALEKSFTIQGSVMNVRQPDGTMETFYEVAIGNDFVGEPADVEIAITGPAGTEIDTLAGNFGDRYQYYSQFKDHWFVKAGSPTPGV
jgi:hypothetical protein